MYRKLFLTFTYIGAFTFGGGYSMLPMFQRELVEKNGWLDEKEMVDLFSISQCLPGVIAVNTAIFVGYKHRGVPGGIVAALGVVLPSVVVISVIAAFLSSFAEIPAVQKAFLGLRVCVSVLIINAVFKLRKHAIVDLASTLIFAAVFTLAVLTSLHVAILIAVAGISGIAISLLRKGPSNDDGPPDEDDLSKDESNASEGGGG